MELTRQVLNDFVLRVLLTVTAAGLIASPCAAFEKAHTNDDVQIERIDVGFGGFYKIGQWAPVAVTVQTARPMRLNLVVESLDPDGSLTMLPTQEFELTSAGTHRLQGVFKSGRFASSLKIHVRHGEQILATGQWRTAATADRDESRELKQSVVLLATLGNVAGFSKLVSDSEAKSRSATIVDRSQLRVVALQHAEELPLGRNAYDALDVLVIAGRYDLDPERSLAIRDWVRSGGHLVISVGSNLSGYRRSTLAGWISRESKDFVPGPIPVLGEAKLRDMTGFESFAGKNERIVVDGPVNSVRLDPVDGKVLIPGLDGSLLVRVCYGFGQITFCAVDLDRPPLSRWKEIPVICYKIIFEGRNVTSGPQQSRSGRLARSGVTDLATQLHNTQDHFPEVRRVSRWFVMGVTLLYLLAIGPVDYFFVHRLLKKPQCTWFTFPAIVAVCAILAVWTAGTTNSDRLLMNQLDVVDVDVRSRLVRSQSWMTVYSPHPQRYKATVEPVNLAWTGGKQEIQSVTPRTSWNGIPEDSFGGMYRAAGFELDRPGYSFAPDAAGLENLPVNQWSTKSLTTSWSYTLPKDEVLAESSLESVRVGELTRGTILHHLPVPLKDWMLAYANRVYRPLTGIRGGRNWELAPGQPWPPSGEFRNNVVRRELRSFLTGARQTHVEKEGKLDVELVKEHVVYDVLKRNPLDLLRMITYHEAAGGTSYTGLHNNALRRLDLSNTLNLGRAVLFGRIDTAAAQLVLNGEPVDPTRRETFVRILLPVKQIHTTPSKLLNLDGE